MATVIILAGGLATRLRPITEKIPKSLVAVDDRPFILHQLQRLAMMGFYDIVISTGYRGDMIMRLLGERGNSLIEFPNDEVMKCFKIRYINDGDKLRGTGGAVGKILKENEVSNPFVVIYGDSYLPGDYCMMIDEFIKHTQMDALMCVYENQDSFDRSNVEFSEGRIVVYDKRERTPQMKHIDWGLNIFRKSAFQEFEKQDVYDLSEVFSTALMRERLLGYEVFDRFYEIGSHQGLEELTLYLREKRGN
ncbi:MAG: NTP transferase domain-containing protein [Oligoflexia bacterium]|nr:NTP transferase domain-containing protein [Oligoflexia bacterium]MBF0366303.1 NTP transferase domain-containing protein [Oligoflexia bacterium]